MDIRIQTVTIKDLKVAIDQNLFWENEDVPLSKTQARWVTLNPNATEDDPCLIISKFDTTIIGHLQLVPSLIRSKPLNKKLKIFFLKNWWVKDDFRDQNIGSLLYLEAIKSTGGKIVVKSHGSRAKSFYDNEKFFTKIASSSQFTTFFHLDPISIYSRYKYFKLFKVFLKVGSVLSSSVIKRINSNKTKKITKNFRYDYFTSFDSTTYASIAHLLNEDFVAKSMEYLNWKIDQNQLRNRILGTKDVYKIPYEDNFNVNNIINCKVYDRDTFLGMFSLINSKHRISVNLFLPTLKEYESKIAAAIIENMYVLDKFTLVTLNKKLIQIIKANYSTLFTYTNKREMVAFKTKDLKISVKYLRGLD